MLPHEPTEEGSETERIGATLHVAWSSDRFRSAPAPVFDLPDGSCAWLAALPEGANPGRVHQLLSEAMRKPPETPQQLRLVLMRVMREIHPRPEGLAAAVTRVGKTLVATTPGASAVLVRGTRVLDRAVDAVAFETLEHDRIALLCNKLDPLLGDADELGRIIGADDPHATAVTLVEIGHLRGGGGDLCAVVAVVGGDELDDVTEDTGSFSVDDLLDALAPTLDGLQREVPATPAPAPRPSSRRRRLTRRESVVPRAASVGAPLESAVQSPSIEDSLVPPEDGEHSEDSDIERSASLSGTLMKPPDQTPRPPPVLVTQHAETSRLPVIGIALAALLLLGLASLGAVVLVGSALS
ncbi:MAG: hypothetical protein KC621_14815 [Myxococcales bacterium]|nr:hypothetical protein [Myxococcales bacterium]